ncbi:MAG: N-acetyltransferase family protein [Candidatus Nanohaloarchaea archaeon]
MDDITIRPARPEDAERLAELHEEAIRAVNSQDYTAEEIAAWTDGTLEQYRTFPDDAERIVAVREDRIIGFGEIEGDEITAVYVDPGHMGDGVGSALLERLESIARENGVERLHAESTISARGFYEAHGYDFVEETTHTFGDQVLDVYLMEKDL